MSDFPAPVRPDDLFVQPRRRFQARWWVHLLLFVLTVASTTLLGINHYLVFVEEFGRRSVTLPIWSVVLQGLIYSGTILGILGAHEMGHYVACRYYDIDATPPYFLPFPSFAGTLGAVIKIREPFTTRTALFDIGIAGPIAGFIMIFPALFIGLHWSTVAPMPHGEGFALGEPLLLKGAIHLAFGSIPDGFTLNIHPMVFAAWFGMLATSWNLLPFGQLDGGHITYATLGRASESISVVTVAGAIVMTYISVSWLLMTLMMVAMLFLLGRRHPRVIYEHEPLGPGRRWLAVFAVIMFVVCLIPIPISTATFP
ncbi:MAG TPA: site-2 protease family protein [Vicinamibacterales bacterium]|nr:site-2 protease family protein [Vicinamibacterales bacterium]